MKLIKKYLIVGALALSAALAGSACGKKEDSNTTQNTNASETSESKEESSPAKKDDNNKAEMKYPAGLPYLGDIDLDANTPELADFVKTPDFYLSDNVVGSKPRCFFKSTVVRESEAESYNTEYTNVLSDVPEKVRQAKFLWEFFVSDERIYHMHSEQDFEIIADKSENVTYGGVDFIREEGHIEVRRKDPSNTYYPELVTLKYVAFYYTYSSYENGMGMAVWGTALGEAGEEGLNNYDLIKETADKSMATLQVEE